jgi:dihydroorotase (multifunctional complex type)
LKASSSGSAERVVIRGGTLWTPDGPRKSDVLVEGDRITTIGPVSARPGDDAIDATGLHVVPGFIDLHVHLADRIGGHELADDFASGTEIAVRSGVTTVFAFATQRREETLDECLERYRRRAAGACHCDVGLHLTPTAWPWEWEAIERLVAGGVRTIKLYTTYREAGLFTGWDRLEFVMRRLAALNVGLLLHCEDDETLAAVPAPVDASEPSSHAAARPPAAEVEAVRRAVDLASRSGCRVHVVHVSTAAGAELVAAARRRGVPMSCETGPQYLLLSDARLRGEGGHRFLCTPPLRDEATRGAMERLAAAGAFDLLATDHCAFRRADKDAWSGDYRAVPSGLPGLGALVPLAYELLAQRHGLGVGELVRRLAENPARVLGLLPHKGALVAGADADVVVLDERGEARQVAATLADAYDPWGDRATTLAVRHVLVRGRRVVREGRLIAPARPAGAIMPWGQAVITSSAPGRTSITVPGGSM